ncbi:MAG: tetratricopeptide repeat protein, partial [Balneolaceae bacterium]
VDNPYQPGFIQIAENYGRTQSGNLANYYAAVILYEQGEIPTALEYLTQFRAPEGIMGVGPVSLRGVLLSELGNYTDAAERFLEAASWSENSSTTPYNLLKAAENFELAGDLDRTRELLLQVEDEYPNSPQAAEAKRLRGLLS